MSSSSSQTAWAAENQGPTMPTESMVLVIDMPKTGKLEAAWYFASPTWVCMTRPCSRATSRQPIMNSLVQ